MFGVAALIVLLVLSPQVGGLQNGLSNICLLYTSIMEHITQIENAVLR